MKNSSRKQETGTMAKRHNTGWDILDVDVTSEPWVLKKHQNIWDLDLYIYSLQQMTALFFTANHQNYSRWFTMHRDKLLKLKNFHPNIYEEFENGCFSLKRTSKPFSRILTDLTLEQIINPKAACQFSGIISLTNSVSARQRWAQSHSIHASTLSKLFEELGMTSKEGISEELKLHQAKQNIHHLEKIISSINDTINPFVSIIEKEHLFNIANGKAALVSTTHLLTTVWTIGFSTHDSFIKDCNDDPNAYQNTIKQQKIEILLLKLVVTKCQEKTKASFQYPWSPISLEASCAMPCKQRLTRSKYLDTC